jgi:ElaB/YqjD/DUF883 family membrane-anchored ribosome-binding protein
MDRARDRAVDLSKSTDEAGLEHPYRAIGVAFGVGAFLGYLISCRDSRNGD